MPIPSLSALYKAHLRIKRENNLETASLSRAANNADPKEWKSVCESYSKIDSDKPATVGLIEDSQSKPQNFKWLQNKLTESI
jgi:hypothetical protein|tara:strand:+ start:24739 stop:24984 length:246 start_codon:yes stop_codon:yes gene_type:complete